MFDIISNRIISFSESSVQYHNETIYYFGNLSNIIANRFLSYVECLVYILLKEINLVVHVAILAASV